VVFVAALEKPPLNNPAVVVVADGVLVKENEDEFDPKAGVLLALFPKLKPEEGEAAVAPKEPKAEV